MKKVILILVLIFVLTAGTVMAMTKPVELEKPTAYVVDSSGQVQIVSIEGEWSDAKKNQELKQGDKVKTGEDGEVEINFYDNSVSRLGPNSEIEFNQLSIDDENYSKTNVSIMVTVGRIWSRVIQLMDKDASFNVTSNTTVATVRGTVFDFEVADGGLTSINAIESIVNVAANEFLKEDDGKYKYIRTFKEVELAEGRSAKINKNKIDDIINNPLRDKQPETMLVIKTPKQVKDSEWFKNNRTKDKDFEKSIIKKNEKINREMAGVLPGSPLYSLKKVSEEIRLAVTSDAEKKESLQIEFASRRLAEAGELVREGKKVRAEKALTNLEKEIPSLMDFDKLKQSGYSDEQIQRLGNQLKNRFMIVNGSLTNVLSNSDLYDLKSKLKDIGSSRLTPVNERAFMAMKNFEGRLHDLENLYQAGKRDEFRQGLSDIRQKFTDTMEGLKSENYDSGAYPFSTDFLERKIQLLEQRLSESESDFEKKLQEVINSLKEVNDQTFEQLQTMFDRLLNPDELEMLKNELENKRQELMNAVFVPEISEPVKPSVKENLDSGVVPENLNQPLLDNNIKPINTVPEGFTEAPVTETGNVINLLDVEAKLDPVLTETPPVIEPIVLATLEVTANKYNLLAGSGMQFKATAYYSDGSSKDVTGLSRWSLSGDVGTVSNLGWLQADQDGGKGIIYANYGEGDKALQTQSREVTALTPLIQ